MHPGAFKKEQSQTDVAIMELVSAGSKSKAKETLSSMAKEARGERDSAYDELKALDHSLSWSSMSLATFIHLTDGTYGTVASQRLQKNERRLFNPFPKSPQDGVPEQVTAL